MQKGRSEKGKRGEVGAIGGPAKRSEPSLVDACCPAVKAFLPGMGLKCGLGHFGNKLMHLARCFQPAPNPFPCFSLPVIHQRRNEGSPATAG